MRFRQHPFSFLEQGRLPGDELLMERGKKLKQSRREITFWTESGGWAIQAKSREMNDVGWRTSHGVSLLLPFPCYTEAVLGAPLGWWK
jgi:hypothetical protein